MIYIYIYQSFLRNHERKTIGHTDIYSLYFKVWLICASLYMGMYIYIVYTYVVLGVHTDSQFPAKGPYVGQPDQFMLDLPLMSSDIDSRRKLYGGAAG